jgi:hypothetical protein
VLEQRPDHPRDLGVLAPGRFPQVDAVEHERAQLVHRRTRHRALHDVAGGLGVLDEVVDQRVDAP